MRRHRSGFSLVEALLSCALLGLVLVPVIGAFRVQLAAASRMQARLRVERALHERLARAELRVRAGVTEAAPDGFQPDGLRIHEAPPECVAGGPAQLWRLAIEVEDPRSQIASRGSRLLIHAPPERREEAQP
jgi:Tfp pilus assembly protein PilV